MSASHARPGADPPGTTLAAGVAWAVLLLCVVAIIVVQRVSVPDPTDVVVDTLGPDMEQVFAGRMIVGMHHLGGRADLDDATAGTGQMLADFAATVERPIDRLRLAVVEAEVAGREPARERVTGVLEEVAEQLMARQRGEAGDAPQQVPAELERKLSGAPDVAGVRAPTLENVQRDARLLLAIYGDEQVTELDEPAREELIARHGWFGRLALTHESAASTAASPAVGSPVGEAVRTVVAVAGVGVALLGTAAVGLVLLILAIVLWACGMLKPHYQPVRWPTVPFLEATALFLVLMIVLSIGMGLVAELTGLPLGPALYLLVPLAVFWPLLRGVSWRQWCDGIGWRRGAGVWREVGSGLVGYVAGLPIIAVGLMLTVLISSTLVDEPEHPITDEMFTGDFWQLVAAMALAVIWAPIVEESIFRGAFYHHMRRRWNVLVSALAVGLVFAVIHPQGAAGVPVLTAVAVVFALIREWRGSLLGPVVAHALHNFGATLFLLLVMR